MDESEDIAQVAEELNWFFIPDLSEIIATYATECWCEKCDRDWDSYDVYLQPM